MLEFRIGSIKERRAGARGSSINNYIINEIKSSEDASTHLIAINLTLIGIFLVFIMNIQSIETLRVILAAKLYSVSHIYVYICIIFIMLGMSIGSSYLAFIQRGTDLSFIKEEEKLFIFLERVLNYKHKLLKLSYSFMIIGLCVTFLPVYYILPYQLNGIVETWEIIGDDFLDQQRYNESIKYYDMVIKASPENIPVRIKMASTLVKLNDLKGALACYDRILNNLDNDNITALRNKGNILYRLGNLSGALACCDKILIDLNPKCEEALVIKGAILIEMDNYADAINACDEAIAINDQNKLAWFNKGNALWDQGKFGAAYNCYNKTTEIDQQYKDGWYYQAKALQKLNRIPESNEAFKKAQNFGSYIG